MRIEFGGDTAVGRRAVDEAARIYAHHMERFRSISDQSEIASTAA
jgi:hypothetical protein